jgi:hypothetical protein
LNKIIAPHIRKRLYIGGLHFSDQNWEIEGESNSKQNGKSFKDGEKALESFKIFAQVNQDLWSF